VIYRLQDFHAASKGARIVDALGIGFQVVIDVKEGETNQGDAVESEEMR
jgi:hypothetical protein